MSDNAKSVPFQTALLGFTSAEFRSTLARLSLRLIQSTQTWMCAPPSPTEPTHLPQMAFRTYTHTSLPTITFSGHTPGPPSSLPTELLARIFALACTDGGRTGRALALVSRQFLSIVEPVQWQTVALRMDNAHAAFIASLETATATRKGGIRHLFISCPTTGDESDYGSWSALPGLSSIFEAVAPTVQTLVFYNDKPHLFPSHYSRAMDVLHTVSWRKLTELTLHPDKSQFFGRYEYKQLANIAKSMPGLKFWHMSHPRSLDFFEYLAESMKANNTEKSWKFTRLRLSGFGTDVEHDTTNASIRSILALVNGGATTATAMNVSNASKKQLTPFSLKHLVLQPAFLHDPAAMTQYLEHEATTSHWPKRMFTLLPTGEYAAAELCRDWKDRVEGWPGCWTAVESGEGQE